VDDLRSDPAGQSVKPVLVPATASETFATSGFECRCPNELTNQEVGRSAATIYTLAWRLMGQEAAAEAVTRDVLNKLMRVTPKTPAGKALSSEVAELTIQTVLARRDACSPANQPPEATPRSQGTICACAQQLNSLMERAVYRLPEIYRHVFVLTDIEGLSITRVARYLGLARSAATLRLHRARLLIHDDMSACSAEISGAI